VEFTLDNLVGNSPVMANVRAEVQCAARSDAKVLLTGESGVGKDIAARMIHQLSARARMPLVTINCVSVPDSLLESELFGHVRGSFTGAYRDRAGLLELAHNGTVFLDEVCEMSTRMQGMLLRFMESGEIQRVGSDRARTHVDVRVIAATNREPLELVANKTFREDLYYRLNVIDLGIPPLRSRREDIPALFEHFLRRYAEARGIPRPLLTPEALAAVVAYDWPGNIRQLKNVAERLIARAEHATIIASDLPSEIVTMSLASGRATEAPHRSATDAVYDRMVKQGESFWSAVYPAFMTRDLTRDELRLIVKRGLRETAGSYKLLVELLNMKPTDYKRFLNFLRKHECHVPFERFRTARRHDNATTPTTEDFTARLIDPAASAIDNPIVSGGNRAIGIPRR
jgi:transcriptional regulator with PAS, ATPase and Fis domain